MLLLFLLPFLTYSTEFSLDGRINCAEAPASASEIQKVAVIISGLNPNSTYLVQPRNGAIMYWPGNEREPYDHFAWALTITPDNCAMGTSSIPPSCGSSNEYSCCPYSASLLGVPPPLLHDREPQAAFSRVQSMQVEFSHQDTVMTWFQDDNCANNIGQISFSVLELSPLPSFQ